MPRVIADKRIVASLVAAAALLGCGRGKHDRALPPEQELQAAVQPAALLASLRHLSGAHFHATAMFRVSPAGAHEAGSREAITTTTDLWIDKQGNFRISESNDQDDGREVVRVGSELGVAIRYGKMIRRAAQDPEPQRFLEEAVGQPFAAWDTVKRFVEIASAGGHAFQLRRRANPGPASSAGTALRKWRETVEVQTLAGEARLDASGGLQTLSISARFRALRDATPIEGELAVTASVDQAGTVAAVTMPAAETLPARQRTILEERALLSGLGGRTPPLTPPKKATASRRSPGAVAGKAGARKPEKKPTGVASATGKKAAP